MNSERGIRGPQCWGRRPQSGREARRLPVRDVDVPVIAAKTIIQASIKSVIPDAIRVAVLGSPAVVRDPDER
ncbi:MAG: hypothetical protein JWM63_2889 [Gammaproteobacteria bacterium]|jgi:hypothetical protein|nr:hypothetical protein [Gammaproteobacteria bacterium]